MKQKNSIRNKRMMSIMIIALLSVSMLTVMFTYKAEATDKLVTKTALIASTVDAYNYYSGRVACRSPNGSLYMIYSKSVTVTYQLFLAKSTDNGATWTNTQITTETGHCEEPSIVSSYNSKYLFVIYDKQLPVTTYQQIRFISSSDNGATWSAPKNISNMTYPQTQPIITQSKNGILYVAWKGYDNASMFTHILFRYSTNLGTTWSAQQNLSKNSHINDSQSPILLVDDNDVLHLAFGGQEDGRAVTDIVYRQSTDHGATWSAAVNITHKQSTGHMQFPRLAINSKGNLTMTFYGVLTGESKARIRCSQSTNGGTTWSAPINITSTDIATTSSCDISCDSQDTLHVTWWARDGTAWSATRYANYTDAGGWNVYGNITDTTNSSYRQSLQLYNPSPYTFGMNPSTMTKGFVLFEIRYFGTTYHIEFYKSNDSDFTDWTTETGTSTSITTVNNDEFFYGKRLVRDRDGYLYCIGNRNPGGSSRIVCRVSADNGATWNSYDVTTISDLQYTPTITTDSSGRIHALWSGKHSGGGIQVIRYSQSTDHGATWSAAINVTTATTYDTRYPDITVNSTDALFATWDKKNNGGKVNVYFSKSTDHGATWSAAVNLTPLTENQNYPKMSVDYNNNIYIVWFGIIPGQTKNDLRFIKSTDGGITWGTIKNITTTHKEFYDPNICIDKNNVIHISYTDNTYVSTLDYNEIVYINSSDGGTTWTTPTNSTTYKTGLKGNGQTAISADLIGNIYITWFEYKSLPTTYVIRGAKITNGAVTLINFFLPSSIQYQTCDLYEGTYPQINHTNKHYNGYNMVYDISSGDLYYFNPTGSRWSDIPYILTNTTTSTGSTTATANGYLQLHGTAQVRFQYGYTTAYGDNTGYQTKTAPQTFIASLTSLTPGHPYHIRSMATSVNGTNYGSDKTFLQSPAIPTAITTAMPGTDVQLHWTTGTGANRTYIEKNTVPSWSRGTGTFLYNGTGTSTTDPNPPKDSHGNILVYYQFWSYTVWGTNQTFSAIYAAKTFNIQTPTGLTVGVLLPLIIGVILFAILIGMLLTGNLDLKFLIGWLILAVIAISILQIIFTL